MEITSQVLSRIIGSVLFLLSLVGAYDYLMTLIHNLAYFKYLGYSEKQIEYFTNYPVPLVILWTLGVWGTVIGSVLLLFGSRWAILSLGVAFFGQLILNVYTFSTRNRWEVLGPKLGTQDFLIFLVTLMILIYAMYLHRNGILH